MFRPTTIPKLAAAAAAIQCLLLGWLPCIVVCLYRLLKYHLDNSTQCWNLFVFFFYFQMYFASFCLICLQPIPSNVFPSFLSHVVITRHACRSFAAAVSCACKKTAIPSSSSSNIIRNNFKRLHSIRSQHRRRLISQVVFCNTLVVRFVYLLYFSLFFIRRVFFEMCAVVFALYNWPKQLRCVVRNLFLCNALHTSHLSPHRFLRICNSDMTVSLAKWCDVAAECIGDAYMACLKCDGVMISVIIIVMLFIVIIITIAIASVTTITTLSLISCRTGHGLPLSIRIYSCCCSHQSHGSWNSAFDFSLRHHRIIIWFVFLVWFASCGCVCVCVCHVTVGCACVWCMKLLLWSSSMFHFFNIFFWARAASCSAHHRHRNHNHRRHGHNHSSTISFF